MEESKLIEDDLNSENHFETPESSNDLQNRIHEFINEDLWNDIGKSLMEYTLEDMELLSFESEEKCKKFYDLYSKVMGFGIRVGSMTKSRKTKEVIARGFVCRLEGYRRPNGKDPKDMQRKIPLERCGCPARIEFKPKDGIWRVEKFTREHNHTLMDPQHIPLNRAHRGLPEKVKERVKFMVKAGIPKCKIMRLFVQEAGGPDKVGFLAADLYNFCDKVRKEEMKDGDAEAAFAFLLGKKASDPSFFIRHTTDSHDRLEKLFWCDSISQTDYKIFGDVVAFDTTYKCNIYNKPFVVLVGVNHHRQTVCFGCALLMDEKEDSFVWVLEKLIEAGGGRKPMTIITDGDKAMVNAIKTVFGDNIRHRLCLWHLMHNVKSNGGSNFAQGFMWCVEKCLTPTDFEIAWAELVKCHGLQKKKWALDIYNDKMKWAEAFMRGLFFAGMRSTQRCEAMHRTLKKVLESKFKLYEFVRAYCDQLDALRAEERSQDYKTKHTFPEISGVLRKVKDYAARIYTRNSYDALCSEMSYESFCVGKQKIEGKNDPDDPDYYWLCYCERPNLWYIVIHDALNENMYCCCMKLESVGLPCRHMFAAMKYENMTKIPAGCIVKRWTIEAKEITKVANDANHCGGKRKKEGEMVSPIGVGDPVEILTGRGKKLKTHIGRNPCAKSKSVTSEPVSTVREEARKFKMTRR